MVDTIPISRVGLVLFGVEDPLGVTVDFVPYSGDFVGVIEFKTSIILPDNEIVWSNQKVSEDIVVLVDKRPEASNLHSVLKGSSGEVERLKVDYTKGGITAILWLRKNPLVNPVFTQKWRFAYSLIKRRVVVASDPILGVVTRTY